MRSERDSHEKRPLFMEKIEHDDVPKKEDEEKQPEKGRERFHGKCVWFAVFSSFFLHDQHSSVSL